jgi:hypothetical protein
MDDLLERHVLPEWHEAGPDRWARIAEAGDDEVWRGRSRAVSSSCRSCAATSGRAWPRGA